MILHVAVLLLINFNMVVNLKGSYESICFDPPLRTELTGVHRLVKFIPQEKCCDGYELRKDTCEPLCNPPCTNGTCMAPNRCQCTDSNEVNCTICSAGYGGLNCAVRCGNNTYGPNCESKCECEHGDCDPESGRCTCHDGWAGSLCSEKCKCQNGATCNPTTGWCHCPPGFTGDYCELTCDDGYWGNECLQQCDCVEYSCNEETGDCILNCPSGLYGRKCEKECTCDESGSKSCSRKTGECLCHEGWEGETCSKKKSCPPLTYGNICNNTCACENGHHDGCDRTTGKCICLDRWYGEKCDRKCECKNGACDKQGNCDCEPGWQGKTCDTQCANGLYGKACQERCPVGVNENFLCHYIRGPTCKAGFSGENCTTFCPERTFGIGCQNCTCNNAIGCDRFTGLCDCYPGWEGPNCSQLCSNNTYGKGCSNKCPEHCPNCRTSDGYCLCQPGWKGLHCQDYCPVDYVDANTHQCIEFAYSGLLLLREQYTMYFYIGIAVVVVLILTTISVLVIIKKKKKRSAKINTRVKDQTRSDETNQSDDGPDTHIYETITDDRVYDQYNRLMHVEVEAGYLSPRHLDTPSEDIELQNSDYWMSKPGVRPCPIPPTAAAYPPEQNMALDDRYEKVEGPSIPSHYYPLLRTQGGRRKPSARTIDAEDSSPRKMLAYPFNYERFTPRYTPPPSINNKLRPNPSSRTSTV